MMIINFSTVEQFNIFSIKSNKSWWEIIQTIESLLHIFDFVKVSTILRQKKKLISTLKNKNKMVTKMVNNIPTNPIISNKVRYTKYRGTPVLNIPRYSSAWYTSVRYNKYNSKLYPKEVEESPTSTLQNQENHIMMKSLLPNMYITSTFSLHNNTPC